MSKPIRSSSLGGMMRCRAYAKYSAGVIRVAGDAANVGSAFAKAQERKRKGEVVDFDVLQAEYGLTNEEVAEIRKMQFRVLRNFEDWSLCAERELACDENLQMVKFDSPKAFLTGHPDVIAFHNAHQNIAQVCDDKSGRLEQLDDWQLIAYVGLILANFPHVDTVDARFDYVRLGFSTGRVDADNNPRPFTREEFTTKLWPRIVEAVKEGRKRRHLEFTVGIQCDRCAPWACPAWNRWREMLRAPDEVVTQLGAEASAAERSAFVIDHLPKLRVIGRLYDELEGTVKGIGMQQDVDLGDGLTYGNKPQEVTKLDGAKALPYFVTLLDNNVARLGELLGPFSKSDLAAIVKLQYPKVKGKYDEKFAELKNLNAINLSSRNMVKVHRKDEGAMEGEE